MNRKGYSIASTKCRFVTYSFFFSSRRRHTRWPRDWSSDVCSSDLGREFLTLGDLRIRVGLDEVGKAVLGEAKIDARIAIELECRSEERRVGKECRCRWSAYH